MPSPDCAVRKAQWEAGARAPSVASMKVERCTISLFIIHAGLHHLTGAGSISPRLRFV